MHSVFAACAAISIALISPSDASTWDCGAGRCRPSFEDYPEVERNRPIPFVAPVPQTKLATKHRTVIIQQSREKANFAGHFRVAIWGCGTDCHGFAIINKLDGRVYTMPGLEYVAGVTGNADDRLAFRLDSRLFVITGRRNDEDEGEFYYLWNGSSLKLILKREIEKDSFED